MLALAILLAAAATLLLTFRQEPLQVPLGVEQAAIVRFCGPRLEVAPYRWGVGVNLRIAQVTEAGECLVYDVRYLVNRAGTFDLKDYLVAADGSALTGLPSFRFQGNARLSRDLDTRVRETEEIRIDVGGHYPEFMALLGLLWIVWLLLLIFGWRRGSEQEAAPPAAAPSLPDRLRHFQAQMAAGTLSAAGKAQLEMLLLQWWRQELALGPVPMKAALRSIQRDAKRGARLGKLQRWLHHPAPDIPGEDIAFLLESIAREAEPRDIDPS